MLYRIEAGLFPHLDDTIEVRENGGSVDVAKMSEALGIPVKGVRTVKVFTLEGLDAQQVNALMEKSVLHDPVLQTVSLSPLPLPEEGTSWIIEVGYRPGVTDNEGRTARDTAALVLGMAKAVSLVLTQGNIIDTMVYGMSSILGGLPAGLSAVIMFLIQTIVNFFINSGSGQAAAMMPIMAPLSDLIGVSRQTAILAFQMGDGLSNMIWPTSASMMAYVFAANEKFESYLKFVLPIFLIVSVLGAIMLVIGTAIGY